MIHQPTVIPFLLVGMTSVSKLVRFTHSCCWRDVGLAANLKARACLQKAREYVFGNLLLLFPTSSELSLLKKKKTSLYVCINPGLWDSVRVLLPGEKAGRSTGEISFNSDPYYFSGFSQLLHDSPCARSCNGHSCASECPALKTTCLAC